MIRMNKLRRSQACINLDVARLVERVNNLMNSLVLQHMMHRLCNNCLMTVYESAVSSFGELKELNSWHSLRVVEQNRCRGLKQDLSGHSSFPSAIHHLLSHNWTYHCHSNEESCDREK